MNHAPVHAVPPSTQQAVAVQARWHLLASLELMCTCASADAQALPCTPAGAVPVQAASCTHPRLIQPLAGAAPRLVLAAHCTAHASHQRSQPKLKDLKQRARTQVHNSTAAQQLTHGPGGRGGCAGAGASSFPAVSTHNRRGAAAAAPAASPLGLWRCLPASAGAAAACNDSRCRGGSSTRCGRRRQPVASHCNCIGCSSASGSGCSGQGGQAGCRTSDRVQQRCLLGWPL